MPAKGLSSPHFSSPFSWRIPAEAVENICFDHCQKLQSIFETKQALWNVGKPLPFWCDFIAVKISSV